MRGVVGREWLKEKRKYVGMYVLSFLKLDGVADFFM